MKRKLFAILVCVLLIGAMCLPASAVASGSLSAGQVKVGDTFTVTVSVSEVTVSSMSMVITKSSNLEVVSGKWLISGMIANFDASTNAGAYASGAAAAVSGKVFQATFKATAPGSASVSIQAQGKNGGTQVFLDTVSKSPSVLCASHSYGSWTKADNSKHSRTCSACGNVETKGHDWNSGKVTKPASCKETGTKTYTCTTCNATKTADIAKTAHSYGSWTKVDNTNHSRTCSVCSKAETAKHTWNSGTVTKKASCKEAGEKTYTCTACNATKTEAIAKTTDHKYSTWAKVNDSTHSHTCSVCSKVETANHTWNSGTVTKKASCKEEGKKIYTCSSCGATKTETLAKLTTHTYDHGCDTDCNVCGLTRTTTHSYGTKWSNDKSQHWHECGECGGKKDAAAHTPGAEATETTAQKCTVCGYIIKAALGHKHSYASTWTTDESGHWYACSGCEEKGEYADHDFENACDPDCSICGYTRETAHEFTEGWKSDSNNHWHECSKCGLKEDEGAHTPGAEATETTAQSCTVCGYELAPALEPEPTEPVTTPDATVPTSDATGDPANSDGFPWWIILVAAVIVAGGVTVIIVIKKKKQNK